MSEARTFRANLKLEGKPCGWCQEPLQLGDEATVCGTCASGHHARCWTDKGGCSNTGCADAPLARLDDAVQPLGGTVAATPSGLPLPPGTIHCPRCNAVIPGSDEVCPVCRGINTPDGLYHGPKVNADGAVSSFVMGLVGLVLFQIILGPMAIHRSRSARKAISEDPRLGGAGLATAGFILGILDLVVFALYIWSRVGAMP